MAAGQFLTRVGRVADVHTAIVPTGMRVNNHCYNPVVYGIIQITYFRREEIYVSFCRTEMLTPNSWREIGSVREVKIRSSRAVEPERVLSAVAISGVGLEGDTHANSLSPRQLLLAAASAYESHDLPPNALRESLLLDADVASLQSGTVLCIGETVALRLMFQCEACGRLNLQRQGLSSVIGEQRGMLARVLIGGKIKQGDRIKAFEGMLEPWSFDWRKRVEMVLSMIPKGMVIEYKQLARVAGVPSSYCRVFPRMIRNLGRGFSGKAVSVSSSSKKLRWLGSELFDVQSCLTEGLFNLKGHSDKFKTQREKNIMTNGNDMYERVKNEIGQKLSGSQGIESNFQFGEVKVLVTKSRSLKDDAPITEAKPYPEVISAVPSDYDSWLS